MPPDTPISPLAPLMPHPHPQYRHIVVKEWYYCRSAWHLVSLWVRLMFFRCTLTPSPPMPPWCPQVEASCGQEWYELASHWPELMFYCVQCSIDHLEFSREHPHPPVQASSAQEWYYCRSAWHLVRLGQADVWADVLPTPSPPMPLNAPNPTPVQASSGQEQYYIRSDWHLVSLWVRLTCLCEGKSGGSSCSNSSSMRGY